MHRPDDNAAMLRFHVADEHDTGKANSLNGGARAYSATLPVLEYPGHLVKRVTHAGTIRFKHKLLFLANALKEHHVGIEESEDGVWSLYLGRVLLGKIDEATNEGLRLIPHTSYSVTHHAGINCYQSSRLLSVA